MENVILTPHIGGATHEAQEAVGVQIALQVRIGERVENRVALVVRLLHRGSDLSLRRSSTEAQVFLFALSGWRAAITAR